MAETFARRFAEAVFAHGEGQRAELTGLPAGSATQPWPGNRDPGQSGSGAYGALAMALQESTGIQSGLVGAACGRHSSWIESAALGGCEFTSMGAGGRDKSHRERPGLAPTAPEALMPSRLD